VAVAEAVDVGVAVEVGLDDVGDDDVAVAVGVDVVAELLDVGVALPVLLEGVLLGDGLDVEVGVGVGDDE
jgi:hypothetical protein